MHRGNAPRSARTLLFTVLLGVVLAACDAAAPRPIQVMPEGLGAGTIVSEPPGTLDCGSICSVSYVSDVSVVVRAIPAPGSRFSGWKGCTSPAGSTCTLMAGTRAIARFDPETELPRLRPDQLSGEGIRSFFEVPANRGIDTPGRFIYALSALPQQQLARNCSS